MLLRWIFLIAQFSYILGFNIVRFNGEHSLFSGRSHLMRVSSSSQQEGESPNAQIKRIVESLSKGEKSSIEIQQELRSLEVESKLLDVCAGAGGSVIGLVTGSLLNGALANGDATWAGPLGYACLGGAAYYGSIQKKRADISEVLISILGQPILNASRDILEIIELKIKETNTAAMKKVDSTVENIISIPATIRYSVIDAKDSTITKAKAIPVKIQNSALNSYNIVKQNILLEVDQKVAKVR